MVTTYLSKIKDIFLLVPYKLVPLYPFCKEDYYVLILSSLEEMPIALTNLDTYIRQTIESYIDQKVFNDLYEHHKKTKQDDLDQPNLSALSQVIIASTFSLIINAAFSIEAYANLLGKIVLPPDFFEKYLDKLPTIDKIQAILEMKYNCSLNLGNGPLQTFRELMKQRNFIAHNKGRVVETRQDYSKHKNKIEIDAEGILKSFKKYNEFMISIDCEVPFLSDLNKSSIQRWVSRKKFYKITNGLLFEYACFPEEIDYVFMVRRHTGFEPTNYRLNKKEHLIQAEKSN